MNGNTIIIVKTYWFRNLYSKLLFGLQHEKEFLAIIASVKGGPQEKRLASQLISRFFKFFPQHTEKAMNAQLDLCEDEDVNVRILELVVVFPFTFK